MPSRHTATSRLAEPHIPQEALQALLQDHQRDIDSVLQRRAARGPFGALCVGSDSIERAETDVQEDLEVALIQMKGDTVRRVCEALARVDAGAYGRCAECQGEISGPRLRALPFAVRCRACEEAYERAASNARGPFRPPVDTE